MQDGEKVAEGWFADAGTEGEGGVRGGKKSEKEKGGVGLTV